MTGLALTSLLGLSSFIGGMIAGYTAWRRNTRPSAGTTNSPLAAAPLLGGLLAGGVVMTLFLPWILAPQDRFYAVSDAFKLLCAVAVCAMILFTNYFFGRISFLSHGWLARWTVQAASEILACVIVSLAGVRFTVLSPIPTTEVALGAWAWPATILWMLFAMNVVKLLDGLEGAASVLLFVASVAVFVTTLGTLEHFLHAFTTILAGASLASLRFTAYPARLSLRGPGTSIAGFLFAVLTVLARQKTVAALLFVFPLVVIVILIAGVVLGSLERILFPNGREP
ncbi:MAG: hypothetical protein ACP5QZ_00760 [Candidatus Sumerlaeaceae bacterium]|jgi:UDP-N-acetylmuramyl pentapeptide phosphotransferase/UDP-N-acetylglucosamine-1-phosphate transferase